MAARKGSVGIAVIGMPRPMPGRGGSMHGGMADEEETDEESPASERGEGEGGGAFDVAAEEFLDDSLPMADRKKALKRAIMACMSEDY